MTTGVTLTGQFLPFFFQPSGNLLLQAAMLRERALDSFVSAHNCPATREKIRLIETDCIQSEYRRSTTRNLSTPLSTLHLPRFLNSLCGGNQRRGITSNHHILWRN